MDKFQWKWVSTFHNWSQWWLIFFTIETVTPYLWYHPSSDALAIVAHKNGQPSNSYQVVSGYLYIYILGSSYLDLFDSILLWSTPNTQGRLYFFFWDSVYPLHVVNLPFIYVNVFTKVGTFAKNYLDILLEFNWTRNSCNLFLSLLPHRHCSLDSYCPISLAHVFSIQPKEQYIFYKFQWGDKSVRCCLLHNALNM